MTNWTDKTELFMEYPPLVAGQTALFAVHLTRLGDFKPVTAGQAARSSSRRRRGGPPATLAGPEAVAAGRVPRRRARRPPRAAIAGRWCSTRQGCRIVTISGTITVFADEAAALADAERQPADDAAAIAYLKEQQWTNEFATAPVQEAEVRTSIRVPADDRSAAGRRGGRLGAGGRAVSARTRCPRRRSRARRARRSGGWSRG